MWRTTLAQVRAHAGRLIASCLAIVIAVAFIVATLVVSDTSRATMLRAVGAQYVDTDLVVAPADGAGDFAQDNLDLAALRDSLPGIGGVAAVAPDAQTSAQVRIPGRVGTQYVSVDAVAEDEVLQWQQLASGRLPESAGEIAVSSQIRAAVGDTIPIQVAAPIGSVGEPIGEAIEEELTVVGIVDLGADPTAAVQGRMFATMDQVIDWGATISALRIAADPSAQLTDVDAALRSAVAAVSTDLAVTTGEERAAVIADEFTGGADALATVLLIFAAVALLVAGMVIANTFAVLLAQRTRELALLRCVGATSRQIRRSVLAEAALTGLVASAIGAAAGIGLAGLVSALVEGTDAAIPLEGLSVPPLAPIAGILVGTVVTLIAALFPARAATRVAPLAALRPVDQAPLLSRGGIGRLILGLGMFLPGLVAMIGGIAVVSPLLAVGGGALSAVGLLVLAQRFVPPVVALAGRLVHRLGGVPAHLAAGNASRNPKRTAATATALLIGVSLTSAMVVGAASSRATGEAELDNSFATDIVVRGLSDPLEPRLLDAVGEVSGVSRSTPLLGTEVTARDDYPQPVLGIDPDAGRATVRGTATPVPTDGRVVLSAAVQESWGLSAGDPLTLTGATGPVEFTVAEGSGTTAILLTADDVLALDPSAAMREIWLRLDDSLDADASAAVVDEINEVAGQSATGAEVTGIVTLRQALTSILDTMLLVVTGLLAVAVVIALIGMGNTLALSVVERRQENGLMRALGLTRGQLRGLLAWEALLVAGVAAVLGVLIGTGYGIAGTAAVLAGTGEVIVAIPWLQVLAVVAVATVAGVLASVLPARRAARTSPVAAIAA